MEIDIKNPLREVLLNGKWVEYSECSSNKIHSDNLKKLGISNMYSINGGKTQIDPKYLYFYLRINKQ